MAPTPRENEALIRRFLTDVVAGVDTDATKIFLADDAVDYNLVFENERSHREVSTLGWRVLAGADVDVNIEDIVATDSHVAARGTVAGTHRESLMDLAPTGRSFEIAYAWFCRVEDGQIAAIYSLPDGLGLLQQVDAIPDWTTNRSLTEPTEYP